MILYSAGDLLWATRIKGTADALSIPCRPVRNADMLRARLADPPPSVVRGLIVDLDAAEVAFELIEIMRGRGGNPPVPGLKASADGLGPTPPADPTGKVKIVAFGPHVETELLERARKLGADAVLPRGAFDRRLVEILKDLAGE